MYRTKPARMRLWCQLPASCALAWPVQQFSDRRAHAQSSSVYLPSTARAGHVISESRLPLALAQFTSGGRREPGDEATWTQQVLQTHSPQQAIRDTSNMLLQVCILGINFIAFIGKEDYSLPSRVRTITLTQIFCRVGP